MMIEANELRCCGTNVLSAYRHWLAVRIDSFTSLIEYTCLLDLLIYLGSSLSTITPLYPAINTSIPPTA